MRQNQDIIILPLSSFFLQEPNSVDSTTQPATFMPFLNSFFFLFSFSFLSHLSAFSITIHPQIITILTTKQKQKQQRPTAYCTNFLCPNTLACVHVPHHCPCPFPDVEDKVELGEGSAVCASKGGSRVGRVEDENPRGEMIGDTGGMTMQRKIELARKGGF